MLRAVAVVSGIYDVVIGAGMLVAAADLARLFGLPAPDPPVLADTNGLFLVAIGVGYLLPLRDPVRWRAYLWLMGPALKGGGALLFLRDYWMRGSPMALLIFALAVWTLVALVREPAGPEAPPEPPAPLPPPDLDLPADGL
jgi:hypothetical protein